MNESETSSLIAFQATSFQQAFVPPYSATPCLDMSSITHESAQLGNPTAKGSRTVPVFRGAFSCQSPAPQIGTQQIRWSVNRASTPCPEASQVHVPHQRIHGRLGRLGKAGGFGGSHDLIVHTILVGESVSYHAL